MLESMLSITAPCGRQGAPEGLCSEAVESLALEPDRPNFRSCLGFLLSVLTCHVAAPALLSYKPTTQP